MKRGMRTLKVKPEVLAVSMPVTLLFPCPDPPNDLPSSTPSIAHCGDLRTLGYS